jgi:hypothetical protein
MAAEIKSDPAAGISFFLVEEFFLVFILAFIFIFLSYKYFSLWETNTISKT